MVVFNQKWLYSFKKDFIQAKVVVFGQSGCIRTEVVVFGQKWLYSFKVIVFGQSCCIPTEMVVFGQKLFYLVKTGSSRGKVVGLGQGGCFWAKVVIIL